MPLRINELNKFCLSDLFCNGNYKKVKIAIIFIITVLILSGCGSLLSGREIEKEGDEQLVIDADLPDNEIDITLYYKYKYENLLVPVSRRIIKKGDESREFVVVKELLKGPGAGEFDRSLVMPNGVEVLDVSRKGNTVFVSLNNAFTGNVDLSNLTGADTANNNSMQDEYKLLAIFSVVNSLTEIDGVNAVKLLIDNKIVTYGEIGATGLVPIAISGETDVKDSPMMAIMRNQKYNFQPKDAVRVFIEAFSGDVDIETGYGMLSDYTITNDRLPEIEEFTIQYQSLKWGYETDGGTSYNQEVLHDGRAFVLVRNYSIIDFTEEKTIKRENDFFSLVAENGIWKVKMPEILAE